VLLAEVVIPDGCRAFPAVPQSSIDELGTIAGAAMHLLRQIRQRAHGYDASEAVALLEIWIDTWVPYQNIPGKFMTDRIVPIEMIERFCGLSERTELLAERTYMADRSGQIPMAYGDLIAAHAAVIERIDPTRPPARRRGAGWLAFGAAVVVAGALGIGAAHLQGRLTKNRRRLAFS
jgi:hypothetical protein